MTVRSYLLVDSGEFRLVIPAAPLSTEQPDGACRDISSELGGGPALVWVGCAGGAVGVSHVHGLVELADDAFVTLPSLLEEARRHVDGITRAALNGQFAFRWRTEEQEKADKKGLLF